MIRLELFRRFARAIAIVLLAWGPLGFQHAGKDDFACAPAPASDDAQAMGEAPDDGLEHCQVCHWTRSLRSRFASTVYVQHVVTIAAHVNDLQPVAHRAPALDRLPARAPPSAP